MDCGALVQESDGYVLPPMVNELCEAPGLGLVVCGVYSLHV